MFLDALDLSLNDIYGFDPETLRFEYANSGACRNLGYSADKIRAMTAVAVLPEFSEPAFRRLIAPLLRGETPVIVFETTHQRSSGSLYPVEIHLQLLSDNGRRTCLAVVVDLSERKRAGADLARRTRQLEILSKTSRLVNAVLDEQVVLRTLVASAMEIAGATSGTAGVMRDGSMVFSEYNRCGQLMPVSYVFPPGYGVPGHVIDTRRLYVTNDAEHDPHVVPEIRKALGFADLADVPVLSRDGDLLGAFELHNSEGGRGFDETEVRMLEALAAAAAVALENAHLMAELNRNQAVTRSQTEVFQKIFDQIPVMVGFTDTMGRYRMVNPEWERVMGWSVTDAQNVDVLADAYPDEAVRQEAIEFIAEASGKWKAFRTRVRDGRIRDILWANVRLKDGGLIGIGQDFTERKQLEEQFRQSQKMEAVGRLAGGMAHDFNNLLTVITGYSQMLLMDMAGSGPAQSYAEEILRASERASRLTSQLLAFSRRQIAQRKVVDLNSIVRAMAPMLRRLIGEDVQLTCVFDPDVETVKVDPGQVEQVVANLAVNARDAMPQGGKLIIETCSSDWPVAAIGAGAEPRSGRSVMLAVSDTGHGMTAEVKAHIFEPFFTTKEAGKGTGLGLSTVYGIVKQNEGEIRVFSEPGHGAAFKIYFPVVGGPAERTPLAAGRDELPRGSETILVVEDEDSVRTLIREILEKQGYSTIEARGGEEALAQVRALGRPVELMVSDVVMPQMTGPQLAAEMALEFPGLRLLYISGYTFDSVVQRDLMNRNVFFLQKPFTPEALTRKVREVLASGNVSTPL